VLAFGGSANGAPKPGHAGLHSVLAAKYPERLYPQGVDLVVHGHVHLFEALGFSTPHPTALLVGNGGTAMEGHADANQSLQSQPAPGARVQTFVTQPGYGFATLDRTATGWRLTERGVDGVALKVCDLKNLRLACPAGI
jgi:hypothetical protein